MRPQPAQQGTMELIWPRAVHWNGCAFTSLPLCCWLQTALRRARPLAFWQQHGSLQLRPTLKELPVGGDFCSHFLYIKVAGPFWDGDLGGASRLPQTEVSWYSRSFYSDNLFWLRLTPEFPSHLRLLPPLFLLVHFLSSKGNLRVGGWKRKELLQSPFPLPLQLPDVAVYTYIQSQWASVPQAWLQLPRSVPLSKH